ncbi:MAG: LPS assembly protein LptD [Rubrivivax sp.]|nr:LPS assembly protein LptD [Rubrivivax sp.]
MRITPLALAVALLLAVAATAARAADRRAGAAATPPREGAPLAVGGAVGALPISLQAQQIHGRPGIEAVAEGAVELRQGGLLIRADRLSYVQDEDRARASGNVLIRRDGMVYSGTELQLQLEHFEGFFLQPKFEFERLGTGGSADRVDFIDRVRSRAHNARYTSCPRDGSGDPDWVLQARRVSLDFDANEGLAEGAVLRFLGVPILVLPVLSFPITDARKSGWLPPSVGLDSRSGFDLRVPYYWNIAPQYDATLIPRLITRRGLGLEAEFRYLEPRYQGEIDVDLLPHDRLAGRSRHALSWTQDGRLAEGLRYRADWTQVSDDNWWKDFPKAGRSLTPRLLAQRLGTERPFTIAGGEGLAYLRLQQWQVLQSAEQPILAPYQRSPQIGVRASGLLGAGFEAAVETEFNRFNLPRGAASLRPTGLRWHAQGTLSRPWREPSAWLVPRLTLRATEYRLDQALADGRRQASLLVPTLSVDAGLVFERQTEGFGRALRQTLEPRLLYVNTPYREQIGLPNFDSAGLDFNFSSIFADNGFSGADRVSDSHQLTFGVTTRVIDAGSGAEALRLGLVQRYLLRPQRVTAQGDGSVDGPTLNQRFSDLLLLGSTNVLPGWTLDAALQYNPDQARAVRSIAGVRYSPGPFRTLNAKYRLARGLSEQLEMGWQWPLTGGAPLTAAAQAAASGIGAAAGRSAAPCSGTWYTVGRVNYSLKDSRVTDSLLGVEYDAGCWIGRVVAERLSTGRSEATTRLLLQLELVGLSRLGSNPLKVLKDNIPGYRLLRDERPTSPELPAYD